MLHTLSEEKIKEVQSDFPVQDFPIFGFLDRMPTFELKRSLCWGLGRWIFALFVNRLCIRPKLNPVVWKESMNDGPFFLILNPKS